MDCYADRLAAAISTKRTRVCVGLDPRLDALPAGLRQGVSDSAAAAAAYREFCCAIVEATANEAACVKPQSAFFEALGRDGCAALWDIIACAHRLGLPVILDAKRGDIGSTAEAYAQACFHPYGQAFGVDAVTVNAYLGTDGVRPFVKTARECGGGVYVLVKTSNPSSGELQDLYVDTPTGRCPVYLHMARLVEQWADGVIGECGYASVGAVVGATYPQQLAELRNGFPTVPFLVPGYGAQGGGPADVAPGFDFGGQGAVVNSSRGILFAYQSEPYRQRFTESEFAAAAAAAALDMKLQINAALGA
jgi:orotidine-5'-phosphate decarboxylase